MYIITFYSFKGGVGRTLALVNVAAELAKLGRRVLLVDFDLEAPGLETFDLLRPPKPHPGIVEYVTEYRRTMHAPDVREYIYQAAPVGTENGKLWVMPAGRRDSNYQDGLVKIDWKELYRDRDGFLLFEDTKAQWEQEFKLDYVLIDSRTGHTDVEGICTRQLPDAVVTLFLPNEQNLVGLKDVCDWIRRERYEGLKKDIRLHFVMSNVPDLDDEDEIISRRVEAFHEELGIQKLAAVIHRYESVLLFNQAVFVLDKPRSRMAREYQRLVENLIVHNPADRDGALQFLSRYAQHYLPNTARIVASEASPYLEPYDPLGLQLKTTDIEWTIKKIISNHLDDPGILTAVAEAKQLAGKNEEAINLLNWAHKVQPALAQVMFDRALCKKNLGDAAGAAEDLLRYLQSPNPEPENLIRALTELQTVAPGQLLAGARQIDFEALDLPAQWETARCLAQTDAVQGLAIQIMKRCITTQPRAISHFVYDAEYELSVCLIRARRWKEAVEVLEAHGVQTLRLMAVFNLAMAHWGQAGDLPESLCHLMLQENEDTFEAELEEFLDAKAIVLWRLGKTQEALRALETATVKTRPSPFSYWRYRAASPDLFLEDCKQLRRMIQGEPIRPVFLGDPPKKGARIRAIHLED